MSQAIIGHIRNMKAQLNKLEVEQAKLIERLDKLESRKKPGPKRKDNG